MRDTLVFSLWLLALLSRTQAANAQSRADAIIEKCASRQKQIESFSFKWKQVETIEAGTLPRPPEGEHPQPALDAQIPPSDVTFVSVLQFMMASEKLRLTINGSRWSVHTNSVEPVNSMRTFDGKQGKSCSRMKGAKYPLGNIQSEASGGLNRDESTVPLRVVYRLGYPRLGEKNFESATLVLEGQKLGDSNCDVLEIRQAPHLSALIWFDRARDYVPVQFQRLSSGVVTRTVTIKYTHDAEFGAVPSEWTWAVLKQGRVSRTVKGTVTSYELNSDIADEKFTFEFPRGTWVTDNINDRQYIIRNDNSIVPVRPGQGMDDYDELMSGQSDDLSR